MKRAKYFIVFIYEFEITSFSGDGAFPLGLTIFAIQNIKTFHLILTLKDSQDISDRTGDDIFGVCVRAFQRTLLTLQLNFQCIFTVNRKETVKLRVYGVLYINLKKCKMLQDNCAT